MTPPYSGSLTGEPLMIQESRIIAELISQGKSDQEIRSELIVSNVFGYNTTKSIPKRVNAILRRLRAIPPPMRNLILEDIGTDGRIVLLYAIAQQNRLFAELVAEEISQRLATREYELSRIDIHHYIEKKVEINDRLQSFQPYTRYKLSSVMFNILKESGVVVPRDARYLIQPPQISAHLRSLFEAEGKLSFAKNLGVVV